MARHHPSHLRHLGRSPRADGSGVVTIPQALQDNHVRNPLKGTLRGLQYQVMPAAQGKLVRVTRGAVLDVAVDIRWGSPSCGRHAAAVRASAGVGGRVAGRPEMRGRSQRCCISSNRERGPGSMLIHTRFQHQSRRRAGRRPRDADQAIVGERARHGPRLGNFHRPQRVNALRRKPAHRSGGIHR